MIPSPSSPTFAVALGLTAMVSCSCAYMKDGPPLSPANTPSIRLAAGDSAPSQAPGPPLLLDVIDSPKTEQDAPKRKEGRFYFALRDAELRQALIAFARDRETSLVISPEVQGKVTVDLKNVTVEEALESLVRPTYEYSYDGRTIRVFKAERITETFKVDYIAGSRSGSSQVTATSSGSSSSGGSASTGGGNAFASASSVQSDFKADFWDQLEGGIKSLLSKDGVATVHRMAGLVTVSDVSDRVKAVRTYLDRVGTEVHGQVLIQAELVEVALDSAFEAGVDWTRLTSLLGGVLSLSHTTLGAPALGLAAGYQRGSNPINADAILRALATQGKVEVLSRPRVLTLNNQKALMKVGREDVFFATTLVPGLSGVAGGASIPFSVSTPRTITVGILLDVSPQIRANGKVALHVHLSITEKFGVATAPDNSATAPILDVREADAVVEVESGQTLSIGGLTQVREADRQEGVPFLSKLPIVGALFRHRLQEKRKVELVLLMTPVVLKQSVTQVGAVRSENREAM